MLRRPIIALAVASAPSKAWLKIKNPKAPAATQVVDGTF
jgi:hypothetical protein